MISGLTFSVWGTEHPVMLSDLLGVLGPRAARATWVLDNLEVAPSSVANRLHKVSDEKQPIKGVELRDLAAGEVQVIEGTLSAREAEHPDPWVVLRAVDGTAWDVLSSDAELLARVADQFPDATPFA